MRTDKTYDMVDFHSHVLPEMDDGSRSTAESLAMLRMEAAQGIKRVVATPHFYANQDTPERFLKRRKDSCMRLLEEMAGCEALPELILGAEVLFFSGISEVDSLSQLTIGEKPCILIEMPWCKWTDKMYHELEMIYVNHEITPIIAHVDRYISPFQTHRIPERLSELPVLVQANAGFFLNRWTQNMAIRMLKKGQIQLLGSDCHNLESRPPRLGAAMSVIQSHAGEELLHMVVHQSQLVLNGTL